MMKKHFFLPLNIFQLVLVAMLSTTSTVQAETQYVTDHFEVMLRTGPSMQNKIVLAMPSGTEVEVLRLEAGQGHSQVRVSSGEIGYMLTRFITDKPAARNSLKRLENQLSQLRSEPGDLSSLLADSQDENRQLIRQNMELTNHVHRTNEELENIKVISGDVITLSSDNQKLESEVQQLLLQLDDIRIQNEALRDNSERIRNLMGVGVLLLGLFLGWILAISGRRNRNSWGS